MTEPIAWINGALKPFTQTGIPLWDLGVVAGAAVTEMARTYQHQPFRLEQHTQRLVDSLTTLHFPQQWNREALLDAAAAIVRSNTSFIAPESDLGIVLFATAGSNATYLSGLSAESTTVIHTFELPFSLWRPSVLHGVRLRVPAIRQIPNDCFPVAHKVRNRLHWWLADRRADEMESGSKALLLDHAGFVTETSTSCFYLVRNGRIATSNRGVLHSLSSQIVEELSAALRIPFERRPIACQELEDAEEAFLSSTPAGLLPVCQIEGRPLPFADADTICNRLLNAWEKLTDVNPADQIRRVGTNR